MSGRESSVRRFSYVKVSGEVESVRRESCRSLWDCALERRGRLGVAGFFFFFGQLRGLKREREDQRYTNLDSQTRCPRRRSPVE